MIRSGAVHQGTTELANIGDWVASYLGNGRIGGCFDYSGMQFQDGAEGRPDIIGDTYFVSQYHYVHGKFGMDYALPIGRLQGVVVTDAGEVAPWNPGDMTEVDQTLDINDGVLRTAYALAQGPWVEQVQFFSQVRKNSFVLRISSSADVRYEFVPVARTPYHYASEFETDVATHDVGDCRVWEIPTNMQTTAVALKRSGDALYLAVHSTLEVDDPVEAGLEAIERASQDGFDALLEEHKRWWGEYWAESDVDLPYPLGEIWRRANYYIGCSLADNTSHPPLVFGLARVQWPAYFPQDYFYAYGNTLSANHLRQAAGTCGFWNDILPHAEDYANRLFGLRGAVYPWTPPVFDWSDYHRDGVTPNACYFELHNSAYVAKMCYDYYRYTLDEHYLRQKAYPVIREIARMYASMTQITDDRAQILYKPISSQDEGSPKDMPNYFDALVSAEYSLALAEQLASRFDDRETAEMCRAILDVGYAYERLEFGDIYSVFEGDTRTDNFQKHPVQLNPITWLPIERFFDDERVINYHSRRYEIGRGYRDATSMAWTLGQFMLASCRLRIPGELSRDIANIQRCRIMDPAFIQTFESSRKAPHFLTTIGLFMQAITETLVQSHGDRVDFFACIPPEWHGHRLSFRGIRLPSGLVASGAYEDGLVRLEIASELGGEMKFAVHGERRALRVTDTAGAVLYEGQAAGPIAITAEAGKSYIVVPLAGRKT